MPKAVSHEAKLECEAAVLEKFLGEVRVLREKLGPLLLQMAPSFAFDERVARGFLSMMRGMYEGALVVEPRNASWFGDEADELMKEFRVARVAADPARVVEAAVCGGWEGIRYWRLHGSPRMYWSAYSAEFLRGIAEAMKAGKSECWCVFDNTASGAALADALVLKEMLRG